MITNKLILATFFVSFTSFFATAQRNIYILSKKEHTIYVCDTQASTCTKTPAFPELFDYIYFPTSLVTLPDGETLVWGDPINNSTYSHNSSQSPSALPPTSMNWNAPTNVVIDATNNNSYWIDSEHERIMKSSLTANSSPEIAVNSLVGHSMGLAVSPIHERLFWSNIYTNSIYSTDLDGNHSQVLIQQDSIYPYRIAVHESAQQLYWVNHVRKTISRIDFDGNNQEVIYTNTDGGLPASLLIDEVDQKLYWGDYINEKVYRANLDGTNIHTFMENISRPVAMTIASPLVGLREDEIVENDITNSTNSNTSIFEIHPNPASDWIKIEVELNHPQTAIVDIFDHSGRLVKQVKITSESTLIDTSDLANGNYLARLKTAHHSHQKKFVLLK